MRKLVTLRKVKQIEPIDNADNIEVAVVDGWKCVVSKGDFSEGDVGIFFEIDSILPEDDRWAFMEKHDWRVRTMKLRGQRSQGLLLPIDILEEDGYEVELVPSPSGDVLTLFEDDDKYIEFEIGDDMTDFMNVKKYEKPIPVGAGVKRDFPHYVPKTDQERIQNIPEIIDEMDGYMFELTEKLDGTSITIFRRNDEFGVCSRNWELKRDDTAEWKVVEKKNIEEVLYKANTNLALQGELVGPGIQGNYYELDKPSYYIYDIWNIDDQRYLTPSERINFVYSNDLNHVPVIDDEFVLKADQMDVHQMLEMADGTSMFVDKPREGIVWKRFSANELGEIISWKAISNEFLD